MLRLANLSLPLDYTQESLLSLLSRKLRIPPAEITEASIVRKSIDARDKTNVHFVVSVDLRMRNEAFFLK
ncbi:MAG: FAD-dependent oxidoreductase, partial [Clostridia bacterium]|nr:FAD-dependent oxidoreductase [Clostridia bacterium]